MIQGCANAFMLLGVFGRMAGLPSGGPLLHGIVVGALWHITSLWCLARLLGAWLGPRPSRRRVLAWLLLKFPALYLFAAVCLRHSAISIVGFGIGFTIVLVVAIGWFVARAQYLAHGC
jgi:hypothetical protein